MVTKETTDGLEVRRANKVSIRTVYVGVGDVQRLWEERKEALKRLLFPHGPTRLRNNVQYLGPIQVVRLHVGWLVPLRLLGEGNRCAYKAKKEKKKKKKKNT